MTVHYKIDGGRHTWPTGATFSATNVIWDFFQGFTCGNFSTALTEPAASMLSAWPNPAEDAVLLMGIVGTFPYALIDATGRTTLSGTARGGSALIDLRGLRSGAYLLRVLDGTGRSIRLLKQ